jgi:hypothetical protein
LSSGCTFRSSWTTPEIPGTAVALAEKRFQELTGSGFRAAALGENGAPGRLIGKFDPEVERTLFIPHLKGG